MFDFDEFDIHTYDYTYLTGILLLSKHDRETKAEYKPISYLQFCIREVKAVILNGYRKYAEEEQEWETLRHYILDIEKAAEITTDEYIINDLIIKVYILLDRAYIMLYEGNVIPNNPFI